MLKKTLATALIGAALIGPAHAAEEVVKEELFGLGGGALAGALVAGPIGFVVGAVAGNIIGQELGQKNALGAQLVLTSDRVETLEAQLSDSRAETQELQRREERLQSELAVLTSRPLEGSFALDVPFRTGSGSLEESTSQQLQELAATLKTYPELSVRLEGHADRRGPADRNLALSEQRAQAVRDALVNAGLAAERIELVPLGEQQAKAEPGDVDGLALDRRVTVQLSAQPTTRDGELAIRF